MKTLLSLAMLLLFALLGGGCALSPQTVTLTPAVDAPSQPIGRGRSLALEVVDERPSRDFGTRGGVYDTAVISPRTDVAETVRRALAERLGASQFVVTSPQPNAPLTMRVGIERIDYRASGEPMIGEVRASAVIRGSIRNGPRTLNTEFQANTARRVVGPPSESENEAILNEVVGKALQRMLSDRAILDLLAQP